MSVNQSISLPYCADGVETCPFVPDLIAVATYQLEDSATQVKVGGMYLYQTRAGADRHRELTQVQADLSGALFDVKWSPQRVAGSILVGQARCDGQLWVMKFDDGRIANAIAKTNDTDTPCLSLDWSNKSVPEEEPRITTSYGTGDIAVWQLAPDRLVNLARWKGHEYEAWITAFAAESGTSTVFTGGDDARLCCWDLRDTSRPTGVATKGKGHSSGVCSIQASLLRPNLVATGSYDEHVILWDNRTLKEPVCKLAVDGGVWRLKWHPTDETLLAAACMHGGCRVIDVKGTDMTVRTEYVAHTSMAYGIDWLVGDAGETPWLASCSFYDKNLALWPAWEA